MIARTLPVLLGLSWLLSCCQGTDGSATDDSQGTDGAVGAEVVAEVGLSSPPAGSLVFSEFMVVSAGPEKQKHQWIEIANVEGETVRLVQWAIQVERPGETTETLQGSPGVELKAGEVLAFRLAGPILALEDTPCVGQCPLPPSGGLLRLLASNQVIDSVAYGDVTEPGTPQAPVPELGHSSALMQHCGNATCEDDFLEKKWGSFQWTGNEDAYCFPPDCTELGKGDDLFSGVYDTFGNEGTPGSRNPLVRFAWCGDGDCSPGSESPCNCGDDCIGCCTAADCPDCGACEEVVCDKSSCSCETSVPCCPNGTCENAETCVECPEDCGGCPFDCGDGVCAEGSGENCGNCPPDCACEDPCFHCLDGQCQGDCECVCSGELGGIECGFYKNCFCGSCDWGETCQNYQCAQDCAEHCAGKECGSYQGCSCGSCGAGENCVNYQCASDCTQLCSGKECGSYQGCGCGSCSGADQCVNNQCLPPECDELCSGKECGSYQGCNCGSCSDTDKCVNNVCTPTAGCGDGLCDESESESLCTCPEDCGTCPGCCVGFVCEPGMSNAACGKLGAPCMDCSGVAKTCANGQCAAPCVPYCSGKCPGASDACGGTCDDLSCSGCCSGTICYSGTSIMSCGKNGETCVNCLQLGNDTCTNGQCAGVVPACGDGQCNGSETKCTCSDCGSCSGCCAGSTCAPGSSDNQCGKNGASCTNCTASGKECQNNQCVCAPNDHKGCSGGKLYWYDSCNIQGSLADNCNDGNVCTDDSCSGFSCTHSNLPNGTSCGGGSACQEGKCTPCCALESSPSMGQWTPNFLQGPSCEAPTCPGDPACGAMWRGRVVGLDENKATLEFKRAETGEPPTSDIPFWVVEGFPPVTCSKLEAFQVRAAGTWHFWESTLVVEDVPVFASTNVCYSASEGEAHLLLLITGSGGVFGSDEKVYFQKQPMEFVKNCQ